MKEKFFASVLLTILLLLFSIQNMKEVTIRLLFFKFNLPLSILIIAVGIIGIIIAFGFFVFKEMSYKKTIRLKNREITALKKEISKLNTSAFGQDIQSNSDESEINTSYLDSIFSTKRAQEIENEKVKEQFDSLLEKDKGVKIKKDNKKSQNTEREKKTSKIKEIDENDENDEKHTRHPEAKLSSLDYKMVGFDDLDLKSFSFENLIEKNKKPDDQWFMGDSKKIDIQETAQNKEVEFTDKIDLKNGYQKILSEFDSKKSIVPKSEPSSNEIKLDKENTIQIKQDAIIQALDESEKKKKKNDDDDKKNPPAPPTNQGKDDKIQQNTNKNDSKKDIKLENINNNIKDIEKISDFEKTKIINKNEILNESNNDIEKTKILDKNEILKQLNENTKEKICTYNEEIIKKAEEKQDDNKQIVEEKHDDSKQIVEEKQDDNKQIVEEKQDNSKQIIEEKHDDSKQIVEEKQDDNKQIIEEKQDNSKQIVEEKQDDNKQIVEEKQDNSKQIIEEKQDDIKQIIEEKHDDSKQIVEEKHEFENNSEDKIQEKENTQTPEFKTLQDKEFKIENKILEDLKKQCAKPLNYNISQDYITTKSFLKTHRQDTSKENTLSQENVMKNFNWSYDKHALKKEEPSCPIKTFKAKVGSIFSGQKDLTDSLNN